MRMGEFILWYPKTYTTSHILINSSSNEPHNTLYISRHDKYIHDISNRLLTIKALSTEFASLSLTQPRYPITTKHEQPIHKLAQKDTPPSPPPKHPTANPSSKAILTITQRRRRLPPSTHNNTSPRITKPWETDPPREKKEKIAARNNTEEPHQAVYISPPQGPFL